MSEAIIIGIDLAKRVFQLHGARVHGSVVFRKKLSRGSCWRSLLSNPGALSTWRLALGLMAEAASLRSWDTMCA